jgi:outer membrane protein
MRKPITLFITILLLYGGLQSQETLSLARAVQIGLANNFDILISQKNYEIAALNNKYGEAGGLPTVDLNLSQNNNLSDNSFPLAFVQGQTMTNGVTGGADVNWILFNGFQVRMNKAKLVLLEEQSEGNAALIVQNTIQSIILAYYNAVVQQKRLEIFGEVKYLTRDLYCLKKNNKDFGSITTFDLLQIQGNYFTDSTNYLNQELITQNAKRNLNVLMARPINTEFILGDTVLPEIRVYNYEVLRDEMFSNNQDLVVQYYNQQIAENDIDLQRAGLYPTVNFNTGVNDSWRRIDVDGQGPDGQSIAYSADGATINYYANFVLSYRLYNGGRVRRAISRAKIQYQNAELNTDKLKLSLERDLANSFDTYNNRIKLLGIADETVRTQKLNLELGEAKFRNGTLSSFNYRDIQTRYVLSSIDRLQAAYNLIESNTELVRLTGGILSQFESE